MTNLQSEYVYSQEGLTLLKTTLKNELRKIGDNLYYSKNKALELLNGYDKLKALPSADVGNIHELYAKALYDDFAVVPPFVKENIIAMYENILPYNLDIKNEKINLVYGQGSKKELALFIGTSFTLFYEKNTLGNSKLGEKFDVKYEYVKEEKGIVYVLTEQGVIPYTSAIEQDIAKVVTELSEKLIRETKNTMDNTFTTSSFIEIANTPIKMLENENIDATNFAIFVYWDKITPQLDDLVLGIHFVNKQNVLEYVANIPVLTYKDEKTIKLAKVNSLSDKQKETYQYVNSVIKNTFENKVNMGYTCQSVDLIQLRKPENSEVKWDYISKTKKINFLFNNGKLQSSMLMDDKLISLSLKCEVFLTNEGFVSDDSGVTILEGIVRIPTNPTHEDKEIFEATIYEYVKKIEALRTLV